MDFSIIIVNYNTRELVRNCLVSIFKNFPAAGFEIIVLDNNSQDSSAKTLENDFGNKIKLIANKKNIGFGPANNQGVKIAKGEYLFFLNSDTIIKSDILTLIKNFFINDHKLGIVCPKLLLEDGREQKRVYDNFPGFLNIIFGKFKPALKCGVEPLEVDWVSGAALVVKKNIFSKVGGFDEKFFMYFEDIDLCKRVKQAGYKILFSPQTSLTHLCGRSIGKFTKRKKYYYQSQDYFYKKHYGIFPMYLMKIIRWPYKILVLAAYQLR